MLSARRDRAVAISAIFIWELGVLAARGRLVMQASIAEYVRALRETAGLEVLPVTEAVALRTAELTWSHQDPADRMIVATAEL